MSGRPVGVKEPSAEKVFGGLCRVTVRLQFDIDVDVLVDSSAPLMMAPLVADGVGDNIRLSCGHVPVKESSPISELRI